jgi:quercetin dioxygenase-like cupin family protein
MSALRLQQPGLSTYAKISFAFVAGILVGRIIYDPASNKGPLHGSVKRLEDTPMRPTSHVDQQGKPITKQQLLEPFVVPRFVGVSVATFTAGQQLAGHEHKNLHEFFYVLEGSGRMEVDGKQHKMEAGTFFHLAPHERRGIHVPADGSMIMAVFGVTV